MGSRPSTLPLRFPSKYAQPLHAQLACLLLKDLRGYWRTADYNATRMLISLGVALIFGSMYWMRAQQRCKAMQGFSPPSCSLSVSSIWQRHF